ncbi:MAG: hypothetical protein DMF60_13020 [Acidobacteria bacterium]|nr:MAG: hypothetical protein DMF60_13020 [Acidobacteriota bacterium]
MRRRPPLAWVPADQRRKDKESSPYINHPIEVAKLLHTVGEVSDMPALVAALLHDTIEDTKSSPDEIRSLFGEPVLSLVLEVTDGDRSKKIAYIEADALM